MSLTKRILIAENGLSREHSKIITNLSKELKPQITSDAERARALLKIGIKIKEGDLVKFEKFDLLILGEDLPESQLVAITADSEEVPTILTYTKASEDRFIRYGIIAKVKKSDEENLGKIVASFYNLKY